MTIQENKEEKAAMVREDKLSNKEFERIKDLPKGTAETAIAVRYAFENSPLFDFIDLHLQVIR